MTSWVYEVHIVGTLNETSLAEIDDQVGNVLVSADPPTTVIRGSVADQSAFVGLVDLIHALGFEVREVRHVPDQNAGVGAEDPSGSEPEVRSP